MQDSLLELRERIEATVVFVTHDIDEAIVLADRVLIMSAGPGRILRELGVNLPRPRSNAIMLDPAYLSLKKDCLDLIRSEGRRGLRSVERRLERFQAKWIPVRVKKTRQNQNIEPRSNSIGTEKALTAPNPALLA